MLIAGLQPNFWRGITDNDVTNGTQERCGTWREAGSKMALKSIKDLTANDQVFRNIEGLTEGAPIYENYDTHTGKPMQASHFSWSAACLLMLYNDYGK